MLIFPLPCTPCSGRSRGGHSWHAKTLAKLLKLYETTVRKFALILSILFSYPKAHVDQNGYLVPPGSSTISSSALSTIGAHMAGIRNQMLEIPPDNPLYANVQA